jgi:hypothetical protein
VKNIAGTFIFQINQIKISHLINIAFNVIKLALIILFPTDFQMIFLIVIGKLFLNLKFKLNAQDFVYSVVL